MNSKMELRMQTSIFQLHSCPHVLGNSRISKHNQTISYKKFRLPCLNKSSESQELYEKNKNSNDSSYMEVDGMLNELKMSKENREPVEISKPSASSKGMGYLGNEMKRSNLIAKQVISKSSALRHGFVSELWVNTISWDVQVVEIRPSLLSGDVNRFFLDNICQVGDVVLIESDDNLINEPSMIGLESLIGYDIVTQDRCYLGKVRDYKFNMNLRNVIYLEFDSLGVSFIPASMMSTYLLAIEDVIEVVSDTIITSSDSKSHIQRLTKGMWELSTISTRKKKLFRRRKSRLKKDMFHEYDKFDRDLERKIDLSSNENELSKHRGRRKSSNKAPIKDDWELPLD